MNGATRWTKDSEGGTFLGSTLIKEWYNPDGLREVKGYIPWVGKVKRKRVGGNQDSCRRMSVGYVSMFGGSAYVSMFWGQSAYVFMFLGPECLCIYI
jgi:hypothetical protein